MKTFSDFGITIPHGATGEIRTLCPWCSDNRKKSSEKCLAVNIEKGAWLCHHCGQSGGLKGEKKEEIEQIFEKPSYKPQTKLPQAIVDWFGKRNIPESILALNRIGYGKSFKDKNGIQFPYYKDGVVVNIKHRSHDKDFRQEKNAEKCLYRFDAIAECKSKSLIITEGEIDALSVLTAGHDMVTSIPDGAPSTDAKNYRTKFDFLKSAESIFQQYNKIILAVDNDAPGKVAERELARRLGPEKCYRVKYPDGCKDANDVLVKHGKSVLHNLINDAAPYPVEGIFSANDLRDDVLSLYDLGIKRGLPTGWTSLDPYYTVKTGEMTIITGIPGSGKSNFLDALMVNLACMHDWSFAVFSPENWPIERHIQTLLEKFGEKPFMQDGYERKRMARHEVENHLSTINNHFHFIMPQEDLLTVDTILEKARITIFRHGVKGIVIDPWNEVEHNFGNLTETQYISQELTKIRRFARLNGVHAWIVAHPRNLSKDDSGNYKPPTMYEISGGANWRNKADNGVCVHRPDFTNDITEIYIQKIRFKEVGKIGQIELRYCRDTGQYIDI